MTSLRIGLADLHDEETRVTDPATGGQKGVKLTQVGALDPVALLLVSRVAGFGANKYAPFNYLKGYDWAHSFNAMQRHEMLFWAGEDVDAESGLPHMAHAAWHSLALISFAARGVGTDTRPIALDRSAATVLEQLTRFPAHDRRLEGTSRARSERGSSGQQGQEARQRVQRPSRPLAYQVPVPRRPLPRCPWGHPLPRGSRADRRYCDIREKLRAQRARKKLAALLAASAAATEAWARSLQAEPGPADPLYDPSVERDPLDGWSVEPEPDDL
ncbi:MAG TPA: dATP/dGTP diphosphohydrolase domain-containing protein [Nocardioides sp.]|nr:dATP/dGTP diphosphohydrolase domain-containing protein [Nocardioides sp.]